ncbi:MAG: DUF2804 domain-containing protein [Candidatus Promineifilaceae bacterium]
MIEKELTKPVNLCKANGNLNPEAVGWSRNPLHTCNLIGHWPRKKRWNYWAITSAPYLFSVTVSNVDYSGLVFVYLADLTAGFFEETTHIIPLGRGCDLPETVDADLYYDAKGTRIDMIQTPNGVDLAVDGVDLAIDGVNLAIDVDDFAGQALSARFTISKPPGHETLNVVIPWNDRTFQFTSKQNTLPADGMVAWGGEKRVFSGDQSFACLDYGRGIWPRDCTWNWGSASGRQNKRTIGLNLGGQWTDGTGYTENGICIDGRLTKISETLHWDYDKRDFNKPWRITAPSHAVDLTFTPAMERVAASDLWLVKSEVHQMFGYYDGTVRTVAGETIPIEKMFGWAEDHVATW